MATLLEKEEAIKRIRNQVNKINKREDRNIEFLGFVDDEWKGMTTRLVLKCRIHNFVWKTTIYNNFVKETFAGGCNKCRGETTIKTHQFSPKEAREKVEALKKGSKYSYDYSTIESSYTGFHEKVTVVCPKHGPFEVTYCNLLLSQDSARCPECIKEYKSEIRSKDLYGDEIQERIQLKLKGIEKAYGIKYEFLGFKPNLSKSGPINSYLILRCIEHNITWDTTSLNNFINRETVGLLCPECTPASTGELIARRVLKTILRENDIEAHKRFEVFDKIVDKYRTVLPDFYIKSINCYIEIDGEQHYRFNKHYHDSYNHFVDRVNRDNALVEYCKENSIRLLRIPYCDFSKIGRILRVFIYTGKDITTHIQPKLLPVPMSYYGQNTIN